ncbi:hypothetical protein OAF54_01155 [bacterium]|nr:hypothetical protein [bacterium]
MENIANGLIDKMLPAVVAVAGLIITMIADKLGDIYHKARKEAHDRKDKRMEAGLKVMRMAVNELDQAIDHAKISKHDAAPRAVMETTARMKALGFKPLDEATLATMRESTLNEKREKRDLEWGKISGNYPPHPRVRKSSSQKQQANNA